MREEGLYRCRRGWSGREMGKEEGKEGEGRRVEEKRGGRRGEGGEGGGKGMGEGGGERGEKGKIRKGKREIGDISGMAIDGKLKIRAKNVGVI